MKILYCENNHFFDVDAYETCPHCGAPAKKDQQSHATTASGRSKWQKLLHKQKPASKPPMEIPVREVPVREVPAETKPEFLKSSLPQVTVPADDGKTQPAKPLFEPEEAPQQAPKPDTDLMQQVQNAAGNRKGKTYGYFQEVMHSPVSVNPVVGWLVAVKGPLIGTSFELHDGKNAIGRNRENHVVLSSDDSVSRSCHASVIFEPKKREFYLQPGSGSTLTYCNNDLVLESQKIQSNALIDVGATTLLLCALCGPDFSWEEKIKENQSK